MTDLLDWLLRLGSTPLRPGADGVQFGFAFALAPWQWAGAAVVVLTAALWAYRRSDGPVWARVSLGAARALLLMLLLALACGPRLQRPNETVERDWVIVLADRSASMTIADAPAGDATDPARPGPRVTREAQFRSALTANRSVFDRLAAERVVLWQGFEAGAFEMKRSESGAALPVLLDAPTGLRTNLAGAIEQAFQRAAARPLAGIVLFSDGRSNDQPSRDLLRRLAAERVPLLVVPLGSADPVGDVAISTVSGPGVAFAGDVVPVEAVVEHVGGFSRASGAADRSTRVQLIDSATGAVLDEKTIVWAAQPDSGSSTPGGEPGPASPAAISQRVTFTTTPSIPGATNLVVRAVPDVGADLVSENNQAALALNVVDRPLRVVYFDGYPRWEYRFLQAVLTRERSIASTAMLVAPGKRYIQEGNTPLDAVPGSPSEWEPFDAIIMGDVQPDAFSSEQLRQIRQRVAVGGAGLLWIAGEGAVPQAWRGTPLGDLLPINLDGGESLRPWDRDVVMRPTPAADRLGVLRLLRTPGETEQAQGASTWWPAEVSDPRTGWSRFRWAQRLTPSLLKPAAEVLATARTASGDDEAALVVSMRYGAGRIIYVATDETWRWRFGRGEDLPERFWLQLARLLGRDSVSRAGKPAILTANPARAEVNQPVRIQAELLDQSLADGAGTTLTVRVQRLSGVPEAPGGISEVLLRASGDAPRPGSAGGSSDRPARGRAIFAGAWIPPAPGRYRLTLLEPGLAGVEVFTDAEAWLADDELRRPETDHALLARLARESGGAVVPAADLPRIAELLPRRDVRITLAPDEHDLWDTPLALILIVILVTFEWAGRRLIRLA